FRRVLFRSGASPRGLAFATQHAEALFIGADTAEKVKAQVARIRELATQQGRNPEAFKLFVGITVVCAETDALAEEKLADYIHYENGRASSKRVGEDWRCEAAPAGWLKKKG